ncbi:MAG: type IVB secretion system protein IcmH/DotU [Gammaproteobacteria bacterium]|nr:type IVB secretion system protein IcmH/DotU [Gammaproteobacteria bacterium]MDH5652770.1 type IVB secretion system protein IcmH/DotU [Gammaproteobacteria bacterium]
MSDNKDKTVFRQPSNKGDSTVVRPMPGGRGTRGGAPTISPYIQQPSAAQQQPPQQPAGRAGYQPMDAQAGQFRTTLGLNPLVNAASMLLAVYEKTRHSVSHPDVSGLHQRLVGEIKAFESKAQMQNIKPEIVLAARYILCSILDEAVLNTPWGAESAWTTRTLLSVFHNETAGGEKFFLILDRMRQMPGENIDILELMYLCLSLGFEGKYRVIHRGKEKLEQMRDELFALIRNFRGEYERALSPNWQGLGNVKRSLTQFVPMWVVASVIGGLMLLSYSGFRYWLYLSSETVVKQLSEIAENKKNTTSSTRKFKSVEQFE